MAGPMQPVALVVDDEPLVRDLLCRLVETAGFTPLPEADAWSVLECCRRNVLEPPSLVITDINMPRLDGIEMVRGLRERWPALPVVFVTGNPLWASRATPLGEVVFKPFDADTLVAAARRAVLSSALAAALSRTGANARAGSLLDLDEEAPARFARTND
jgi:two-component system phosphate regulon response regulator OmpR